MRKVALGVICLCACVLGAGQAVWELTQPVGEVSEMYCKRPERPCMSITYEVPHEAITVASHP
jgi:hypothetical protein